MRSIPACAGEPARRHGTGRSCWVYPRVCGGTTESANFGLWRGGLSPRVRGNPKEPACPSPDTRSIPACAGEPQHSHPPADVHKVYPRVCGGTGGHTKAARPGAGLSPRVRGNQYGRKAPSAPNRSIPACAGEPRPPLPQANTGWVYPRVCGGTYDYPLIGSTFQGLSPRVRGNRLPQPLPADAGRSIPACAGEPKSRTKMKTTPSVYPRVCGGTSLLQTIIRPRQGLSPRVRGNPCASLSSTLRSGSIPACAGEPEAASCSRMGCRVYPRVCGGTMDFPFQLRHSTGLSPRVRGNRMRNSNWIVQSGSIPACAGEPRCICTRCTSKGVYPRVCGGTARRCCGTPLCKGLSPRVRGNPGDPGIIAGELGSIPACAGEPSRRR